MSESLSLQSPIERMNGKLTLQIPLDAGGKEFIACSRGLSEVKGKFLVITVPDWIAAMLRVRIGDPLSVSNEGGNLHFMPAEIPSTGQEK